MIYTLSAVGLLRIIIYILAFYFIVKIVTRLFAPLILRFVAKKAEQKFGGFQNEQTKKRPTAKEGETVIDKMPKQNKSSNQKVGEYVDYEEID